MSMIETPLPYRIDLDKGIKKTYLDTLFATEDNQAHRFDIDINRGGVSATFGSGATVSAYFIRYCDNGTLAMKGTLNGHVASVTLDKTCYNKAGAFALVIKVTDGGATSTVFYGEGSMLVSRTDTLIDTENVVPSLSDLLAQIEVMERGTQDANEATERANTATENAIAATQNASKAANRLDNMTASATGVASTSPASAVVSKVGEGTASEHYDIALQIPVGKTPEITFEPVQTGDEGTQASATVTYQDGDLSKPVIALTIPRGNTGAVEGIDYYEDNPSALGTASQGTLNTVSRGDHVHPMPTAQDVGARPDTWTPAISDIDGLQTAIDNAGGVKTVAGVSPDDAGNVALTAQNVCAVSLALVWENASPSSSFAAQKLPDAYTWTGYDYLLMVYIYDIGTTARAEYKLAQIVDCASGMKSYLQMYSVSGGLLFAREIILNDDGTIEFGGAKKRAFGSITTVTDDNGGCIPLRIYGAKGVAK